MTDKQGSSQAAWALLMQGVTAARLEAHRLRHLINRGMKLVEASPDREHIQQMAGDLILALPKRLTQLDGHLDRTSLALIKMGEEFLDSRLSLSDKTLVEEAVSSATFTAKPFKRSGPSAGRVAHLFSVRHQS